MRFHFAIPRKIASHQIYVESDVASDLHDDFLGVECERRKIEYWYAITVETGNDMQLLDSFTLVDTLFHNAS
jgi:hypothetical protein